MQLGTVVVIADLSGSIGIVEQVAAHAHLTVYGVRTLSGMLYGREAADLTEAPAELAEQFRTDLRLLAPAHADLLPAVKVLDAVSALRQLLPVATGQPEQVRAWMVRHGLDVFPALTAEDVLAARDVDHSTAAAINRTYDLLGRYAR